MPFTFDTVDIKQELKAQLEQELVNFGYTGKLVVKVLTADPKSPAELPCIGINRIDDSESDKSLSEGESTEYEKNSKILTTLQDTFFSEALEIRVWHTNADERDKLYKITKAILFAHRNDLIGKGLVNVVLRGGKDEQDSTMAQAPDVLYWATITMTCLNPLTTAVESIVEPITEFIPGQAITGNGG
jgi:hypothetical protein